MISRSRLLLRRCFCTPIQSSHDESISLPCTAKVTVAPVNIEKDVKIKAKRIPVVIKEEDITEQFVRGSGPGGQATNKTNNKVVLHYSPLGLTVSAHETRSRHLNRQIARDKLAQRLDELVNGAQSRQQQRVSKQRRRKAKARRRAAEKYGQDKSASESSSVHTDEEGKEQSQEDVSSSSSSSDDDR